MQFSGAFIIGATYCTCYCYVMARAGHPEVVKAGYQEALRRAISLHRLSHGCSRHIPKEHMHKQAFVPARTHACTHARAHVRTHTYTHTHAQTHTHTHTHAHTHTTLVCFIVLSVRELQAPTKLYAGWWLHGQQRLACLTHRFLQLLWLVNACHHHSSISATRHQSNVCAPPAYCPQGTARPCFALSSQRRGTCCFQDRACHD